MAKTETNSSNIIIRHMTADDTRAVESFQTRVLGETMPGWTAEHLAMHVAVFPEGQLIAVDQAGRIMGSASSLVIDWDDYAESAQWSLITGNGEFTTHNPKGKTLYGADMLIDPEVRGKGIGTRFYEARKKIVRDRGLKRLLTGGRIPGYAQVSHELTPKEYVHEVLKGKRKDPTLNFQLKNGFVVLDIIPEYLHDTESRGFATLLEWLNPEYVMSLTIEEEAALEEFKEEKVKEGPNRVRIAAMQYLLRPINCFDDFATQVEFFVHSAKDYKSHFIVFPRVLYDAAAELSSQASSCASRASACAANLRVSKSFQTPGCRKQSLYHWRNAPNY